MTKPREKTREELQAEIEDGKKKIRQLENREKMLRQKLSKEERRTRSHRLIVRGAVFESIVPEAKNMTDEEAAALLRLPHMRIYAIEDVVKQALSYSERHNRKIVFAYLLLPGINDRPSDVRQLAKWFRGKKVMINVLQYNPTSNSRIKAPQKREIVAFKHQLEQAGLEVTMRVSHGREINAACGQLANTYNKFKKK